MANIFVAHDLMAMNRYKPNIRQFSYKKAAYFYTVFMVAKVHIWLLWDIILKPSV